jgi:hypothetical protein
VSSDHCLLSLFSVRQYAVTATPSSKSTLKSFHRYLLKCLQTVTLRFNLQYTVDDHAGPYIPRRLPEPDHRHWWVLLTFRLLPFLSATESFDRPQPPPWRVVDTPIVVAELWWSDSVCVLYISMIPFFLCLFTFTLLFHVVFIDVNVYDTAEELTADRLRLRFWPTCCPEFPPGNGRLDWAPLWSGITRKKEASFSNGIVRKQRAIAPTTWSFYENI